jgi:hypothetical protein
MLSVSKNISLSTAEVFVSKPVMATANSVSANEGSVQTEPIPLPLMAFPDEILVYIMQKIKEASSLISLKTTCQRWQAIYEDDIVYTAHERQYHWVVHYRNTPALCHLINAGLINAQVSKVFGKQITVSPVIDKVRLPDPHTLEWQRLKDQSIAKLMVNGQSQGLELGVKKLYIMAWNILQHVNRHHYPVNEVLLMKILLDLGRHIHQPEAYVAKLFDNTFPHALLHSLANVHLEWSIQLVGQHFSREKLHQFMVSQLSVPAAFANRNSFSYFSERLSSMEKDLETADITSLLCYVIEHCPDLNVAKTYGYYCALSILLQKLFTQGCDLEGKNLAGQTPLVCALLWGKVDIFSQLLQMGADYTVRDKNKANATLLMQACLYRHGMAISLSLLCHDALDINATDDEGDTALVYAVRGGFLETVKTLLQHPDIKLNIRNRYGNTILISVINCSTVSILQALVTHPKMDFNTLLSGFYYAIKQKKEQMIETILHTMTEEKKNDFLKKALAHAVKTRQLTIAKKLRVQYGAGN